MATCKILHHRRLCPCKKGINGLHFITLRNEIYRHVPFLPSKSSSPSSSSTSRPPPQNFSPMRKPTNPIQSPVHAPYSSFPLFKLQLQKQQSFHFKHSRIALRVFCSSQHSRPPQPSSTSNENLTTTLISILTAIPNWADEVKERGMRKKRSLYNHEKWVEHRSSLRHIRHLSSSLGSRVILSLVPPVLAFTTVAVLIASYNSAVTLHWLPEFFPVLRASSLPYQLTAPALALLLVFRTEASYSRYEEGRKAWIKVISGTNDFARQVIATVVCSTDSFLKRALLQYIMAFPVALKCHLIHGSDVSQDLRGLLDDDDLAIVLRTKDRPRCLIEFISQSIKLLNMDETKRNMLETKISCFHEGMGVCEELMGIPIPLSYTRLTSRFLVLWHLTLPIILWDDCNWIVVPATFISAASLFCIEEVGVLIEEPFSMLALDELCDLVHSSVREAMGNEEMIQAQVNAKRQSHFNKRPTNGWPASQEYR